MGVGIRRHPSTRSGKGGTPNLMGDHSSLRSSRKELEKTNVSRNAKTTFDTWEKSPLSFALRR